MVTGLGTSNPLRPAEALGRLLLGFVYFDSSWGVSLKISWAPSAGCPGCVVLRALAAAALVRQ